MPTKEKKKGGLEAPPRPVPRRALPVGPVGRKWLKIDKQGNSTTVAIDRHKLTHELGVQTRDLRILDPKFTSNYPSAILCREKALVINLPNIKAIVTTEYMLMVNPESSNAELGDFMKKLEDRFKKQEIPPSASFPVLSKLLGEKKAKSKDPKKESKTEGSDNQDTEGLSGDYQAPKSVITEMPFELKALEVCLESVCSKLDSDITQLEGNAFPAVDDLTLNVNTKNLQRVRGVKSKIAQHKTKVETVKEILEKFLDDDEDMKDMNLSSKLDYYAANDSLELQPRQPQPQAFGSFQFPEPNVPISDLFANLKSSPRGGSSSSSSNSSDFDEAVSEVEMLLEAYFMQLDNIYNRLATLDEYIDDTEDYINIVQDKHRNQLLQLELIITAGTFALTIMAVVSGIFGMNLENRLAENKSSTPFLAVTGLSTFVALTVLVGILWFCRAKGLMSI